MSFPWFAAPAWGWLLLLAGPVILLYFLKLKRPRLEIPSLVLWRQVLQDQRVNSPLQKFKRNLLLLLQLLLLMMVVLAVMQPYLRGDQGDRQRRAILIDTSASMAARDAQTARSRLDVAVQQVRELIGGLRRGQELCLIRFSDSARLLTDFTDNPRVLQEALDGLSTDDVESNLEDALRIAEALAQRTGLKEVILLSDGNLPVQTDFALPFELTYRKLPPAGPNIGVTMLSARRNPQGERELFVRVEASEPSTAAELELLRNGDPVASEVVTAGPDSPQRLMFRISGDQAASLTVRLKPDGFDALATDNAAYLELPPSRPLRVYVSSGLPAEALAASRIPGVSVLATRPQRADLVITDQGGDDEIDAAVMLQVGGVPANLGALVKVTRDQATAVIDWDRRSALLEYVELGDVLIMDSPVLAAPPAAEGGEAVDAETALEQQGWQTLAWGREGPLIVQQRGATRVRYQLLFQTSRSTLPYRVGFPVMLANAAKEASQRSGLGELEAPRTGVLPALALSPRGRYDVVEPSRAVRSEQADERGSLSGVPARRVGRYEIRSGGSAVEAVGVSLLSPLETGLAAAREIRFNEISVASQVEKARADKTLWPWLAWLALALLLAEWWYFHRPRGVPQQ